MDGITFLVDENDRRRFVQIDLDKYDPEAVEDLLDGLIAESRKNEETVAFEEVVEGMKAAGNLDANWRHGGE